MNYIGILGWCAVATMTAALMACGGGTSDQAQAAPASGPQVGVLAVGTQGHASGAISDSGGAATVVPGSPKSAPSGVKWHPGHYVLLAAESAPSESHLTMVIDELKRYSAFRGVQIRYGWAELEPKPSQYDFTRIERDLALLDAAGLRLFILLQTKAFDRARPIVPDWLTTEDGASGVFTIEPSLSAAARAADELGANIKLWDSVVAERLSALLAALGAHFDRHKALEGLAMTETALGRPVEPLEPHLQDAYFTNLEKVHAELRRAFPGTVTLQFVNYPRRVLPSFIAGLTHVGSGIGGPDILLDDPGLNQGVYPYYASSAGVVPLAPSVQAENYRARIHGGPYDPPTIDELYRFGRDRLHANYMFWARVAYPKNNPFADVLDYVTMPNFPADPAGGLRTGCPTQYPSCIQ